MTPKEWRQAVGTVFAVVAAVVVAVVLGLLAFAIASLIAVGIVATTSAESATRMLRATAPVTHFDIAPPEEDSADRDPAYRSYLFGPVLKDLREVVIHAAERIWTRTLSLEDHSGSLLQRVGELWDTIDSSKARRVMDSWGEVTSVEHRSQVVSAFFFLSMIGGVGGTVAGSAIGTVLAAAVLMVFALLVAVSLVGALACAELLKAFELIVLRVRGITLECGNCHRRVISPAYDCDACPTPPRARHRQLVPGKLGVLKRTCRCGNALPTLLMNGKAKLPGYCQHEGCNYPLPVKGLTAPTFHIPVVAGTSAGKTVLMLATVADLDATTRGAGRNGGVEFADEARAAEVRRLLDAVRNDSVDGVAKTLPELPLRALTLYHGAVGSRNRRLLYLYDAAGERYETSDGLDTLRFLGFTAGTVFVVDPFAIAAVSRTVDPNDLQKVRASTSRPVDAAERFTQDLRSCLGVRADRRMNVAAAVVVTKCDALLTSGSISHPYEVRTGIGPTGRDARSAAVRAWLEDVGLSSIVAHVENSYRSTSYFAVSALAAFGPQTRTSPRTGGEVSNDDPADPARWLLAPKEVR